MLIYRTRDDTSVQKGILPLQKGEDYAFYRVCLEMIRITAAIAADAVHLLSRAEGMTKQI